MSAPIATWDNAEPGDTIGKPKAAKHTQGPWEVSMGGAEVRQRRTKTFSGPIVAKIYDTDEAVGLANARLIAAAPDLLATLEVIAGTSHSVWADGKGTHDPKCRPCLAAAAVANAKGGAA